MSVSALADEIRAYQRRLGTATERPADYATLWTKPHAWHKRRAEAELRASSTAGASGIDSARPSLLP